MSTLATASYDSSSDAEDGDFIPDVPKSRSTLKRKSGQTKSRSARPPKSHSAAAGLANVNGDAAGEDDAGESSAESSESESDDEGDGDDAGNGDEEGDAKRRKIQEEEERRRAAREAFAAFASAGGDAEKGVKGVGGVNGDGRSGSGKRVEVIDVKRPRQFAGETIYETVRLHADHPDAIAYTAAQQAQNTIALPPSTSVAASSADSVAASLGAANAAPAPTQAGSSSGQDVRTVTSAPAEPLTPASAETPGPSTAIPKPAPSVATIPPKRAPPKRKPRQSLEAMSAALDKGKKMTTLEKSQMDWQSHLSTTQGLSDELASNRRSGGYLEKRDFLDRVEDRRLGAYEQQMKGAGRR